MVPTLLEALARLLDENAALLFIAPFPPKPVAAVTITPPRPPPLDCALVVGSDERVPVPAQPAVWLKVHEITKAPKPKPKTGTSWYMRPVLYARRVPQAAFAAKKGRRSELLPVWSVAACLDEAFARERGNERCRLPKRPETVISQNLLAVPDLSEAPHASPAAAKKESEQLIAEKAKKGYRAAGGVEILRPLLALYRRSNGPIATSTGSRQ